MLRNVPVIIILGCTGSGKTKLSLDLCRKFRGSEIISADSMQVYKGLSTATAKATSEERSQAPHHMLDIATPNEPFTVTHFRDMALPIIDNLLQRSKIPIIVGGTNYYIESILWHNLVSPGVGKSRRNDSRCQDLSEMSDEVRKFIDTSSLVDRMEEMDSSELHQFLQKIDPVMANRLHPNNKRKIMRALEVFKDHGQRLSDIIADQRKLPGGPKRYENIIIFWLQCNQETLNQRLDSRVDSMVKDGLLDEIRSFYNENVKNRNVDFEEGILQTIGFKEFIPYLQAFEESQDAMINRFVENSESTLEPEGWKSLVVCLEELKMVTRRYSKKQIKWIRNRFLGSDMREVPLVYPLDTSDVSKWNENVSQPAIETVQSYIESKTISLKPVEKVRRLAEGFDEEKSFKCQVCDRVFIGEFQWDLHKASNKHKRTQASKRRREKLQDLEENSKNAKTSI